MNSAYKHLDAKLRIFDLTIGQWAMVFLGLGLGIAWGTYVHPLGPFVTMASSIYIAGIPIMLALLSSQVDFALGLRLRSYSRWRRRQARFAPGAGQPAGYVIVAATDDVAAAAPAQRLPELDPLTLWQ